MYYLFLGLILLLLFYFLGKCADIVVINARKLGEDLDIKVFFLGIILGSFTTLPELSLGINAFINNLSEISLGNLLGGIVILFTLILGGSIVINRKISTNDILKDIGPILFFLLLPIILGLKGNLGIIDGVFIILSYIVLIFYLFKRNNTITTFGIHVVSKKETIKRVIYIIIGLVLIMLLSNLIINVANRLLDHFILPAFLVGLIFFALGTNLPEITLVFRSWQRGVEDLSLSNLFGSAMANVLLIGIFISIRKVFIEADLSYIILALTYVILFILLTIFARTNKEFKRIEGMILLGVYILFLFIQTFLFLN